MMFSVIIPVYNVAPYLRECLDSVLAQTYSDWEAICVDDGSTDGSGAILEEYAAQDSRVRIIHQSNAGVSSARNAALKVAEGDWVLFVDADDVVHQNLLENLSIAIDRNPEVLGVCHYGFKMGAEPDDKWQKSEIIEEAVVSVEYTKESFRFTASAWMSCLRKDCITHRFGVRQISEDREFLLKYYLENPRWAFLEAPLYFYRLRPDSAVNMRPTFKSVKDYLEVELELARVICAKNGKFSAEAQEDILLSVRASAFLTHNCMYFNLASIEGKSLFPLWLELQRQFSGVERRGSWFWFVVGIAELSNSAIIVRTLVRGRLAFGKFFYGVLRWLKK